jgi:hypothetical protein
MATPEWVKESFNSFTPGTSITKKEVKGDWLHVSTDTPGSHRFADDYPPLPPSEGDSDGTHIVMDGPGSVIFRLDEGVGFLYFSYWNRGGTTPPMKARFFDRRNDTVSESDFAVGQVPLPCFGVSADEAIYGVELSRPKGSLGMPVGIDNVGSAKPGEEQLAKLKQVADGTITWKAWIGSL